MSAKNKSKDVLFWGLVLVVVGALLLLENLNVDALHYLARLWPIILIAWGAWKLYLVLAEKKAHKARFPERGE